MAIKTRLHFSQSSQPSSSQCLNNAFSKCQLESQMDDFNQRMSQHGPNGCDSSRAVNCSQQTFGSQDLYLGCVLSPYIECRAGCLLHAFGRTQWMSI